MIWEDYSRDRGGWTRAIKLADDLPALKIAVTLGEAWGTGWYPHFTVYVVESGNPHAPACTGEGGWLGGGDPVLEEYEAVFCLQGDTRMTNYRYQAALIYAARGWRVIALHTPDANGRCSCGSSQCAGPGKHPRYDQHLLPDGLTSATVNPEKIRAWWSKWPSANVGIVTGRESGIVAVDVDPDHGGADSWRDIEDQYGAFPDTPESLTGGGGRHLILAHPGVELRNSASKLGAGLDIRGDGGYIVAPPSLHASGRVYVWEVSRHPADVKPVAAPEWFMRLLLGTNGNGNGRHAAPLGEHIANGSRNATLASIAGTMRRRGVGASAILAALVEVNAEQCTPPLPFDEIQRIALSVAQYAPATTSTGALQAVPAEVLHHPHTDTGNAEVLQALYGDRLRYDWRRGRWLVWIGERWQADPGGELTRLAVLAARARLRAAAEIEDDKAKKAAVAWALQSENSQRIKNATNEARALAQISDTGARWDADHYLLACANGVIDLRTGTLRKAQACDRITMNCHTPFNPDAPAPRFERFLSEVFGGAADLIGFIQRAVGYSLTGDTREQKLFLCHGGGANGKSTLLNILRLIAGDYAFNTPFSTFEVSPTTQNNDLAALERARLVTASETSEARHLNEGRVKAVTGGDPVTCRFLYHESFTYTPALKLWLAMNHKPIVTDTSEGMWRRVMLIPFLVSFTGSADHTLADTLRAEAPGILAWGIRGALAWQSMGLRPPACVQAATDAYREESDELAQFMAACCLIGGDKTARAGQLYEAYKAWAGRQAMNMQRFGRRMGEREGITKGSDMHGAFYRGIGIAGQGTLTF